MRDTNRDTQEDEYFAEEFYEEQSYLQEINDDEVEPAEYSGGREESPDSSLDSLDDEGVVGVGICDGHAQCGGIHHCPGEQHRALVTASEFPDHYKLGDEVGCDVWFGRLCRVCYCADSAVFLWKKNRQKAAVASWTARDANWAARCGLESPPSATRNVVS